MIAADALQNDDLSLRKLKARTYAVTGALVVAASQVSLLFFGRAGSVDGGWQVKAILLGVGLGLVALAAVVRFTRISLQKLGFCAVGLGVLALTGAVLLQKGTGAPAFAFLVFLPLVVAVGAPDNRPSIVMAMVCSLLIGSALALHLHGPSGSLTNWLAAIMVTSLLALHGTRQYQRLLQAQREADEARIRTLQMLNESEVRRASSERLALVGQLAAGVAHEINNPLSFASSNLRFVQGELSGVDNAELHEALNDAAHGLERIAQIVRDLKASARHDEDGEGECALGEAVQEALRMSALRLDRAAIVEAVLPPELPNVRFQSRHLVQVLVNLLVNAADAVEERGQKGKITLRVVVTPPHADRPDAPPRLRVEVEDDGPGFSADVLPRVFDPFFTTKPPGRGTGLGLPLSREYARRYGADLRAENRPEGGARMALELLAA